MLKTKVILLKAAQKDLDRLDSKTLKQVLKVLDRLAKNPKLAKRLSGELKEAYSYRFGTVSGEFRIAFLIEPQNLIILAIGPRENFYDFLKKRL